MTGRVMQPRKRHESKGSTLSKNGEDRSAEKRPDTPTKETSEVRRSLPGSKNSARHQKSSARKPGDLEGALPSKVDGGQAREGDSSRAEAQPRTFEKSDACMVPGKSPNAWVTPAEGMEGRRAAKGKLADGNASRSQSRQDVLTQVERVGQRASVKKEEKFTNLLCHIKVPLLAEAYYCLRKNAAPGVDGETWSSYGLDLEAKLLDLEGRVHRGSYHPQPVRRVHIPKGNGRTRPLGIPALEDKIVQQAVRMILEPIYEEEFLGFSYGFRPGRSQHQALDALAVAINRRVSWVLDADIRSFFDTIDHEWLKRFVEHRIGDKRLVRLLMKWLHAGVLEDGEIHEVEEGAPQGGIISPLLSNIYLHYVLDRWVQQWRKQSARGEMYFVRYADDFVAAFQFEDDANAMHEALAKRFAEYRLELHPEKTRVLRFGRFARASCAQDGRKRPETFVFLGFTHISAEGPDGRFRLVRRTARKKREAKLSELRKEMRWRRHVPVVDQHRWLVQVLRGHANYYGVPGNSSALSSFRVAGRPKTQESERPDLPA
jgi:RNA-directed DNA polymerase